MISTRSVGLLIDTVVCLTLAKWETVSGRFGGYLSHQRHPAKAVLVTSPGPLTTCFAARREADLRQELRARMTKKRRVYRHRSRQSRDATNRLRSSFRLR